MKLEVRKDEIDEQEQKLSFYLEEDDDGGVTLCAEDQDGAGWNILRITEEGIELASECEGIGLPVRGPDSVVKVLKTTF